MLATALGGGLLMGGTPAHAWHGICTGGAATGNLTPGTGKWNGFQLRAWHDGTTNSDNVAVCWDLNDSNASGGCAVGANCGNVTFSIGDPDAASIGKTVTISSASTTSGSVNVLSATGAELGVLSGTTISRTVLYIAGVPVGIGDNPTGVTITGSLLPTVKYSTNPIGAAVCGPTVNVLFQGQTVLSQPVRAAAGSQSCP